MSKRFELMFVFVSWTDISLGINLDLKAPRAEIHVPFGFILIGWREVTPQPVNWRQLKNYHYYLIGNPHYGENK